MKKYPQISLPSRAWPIWHRQKHHPKWQQSTTGLLAHDKRFSKKKFVSVAVGSLLLLSSASPALHAGTITVTEPTIGGPNGCDLVEAIYAANNDQDNDCTGTDNDPSLNDADTILFAMSPDTVNLTTAIPSINADHGDNGLPVVTSSITINGNPGGITLTRNSGNYFRIIEVDGLGGSGGKLALDNMNIHNGHIKFPAHYHYIPDLNKIYEYGGGLFVKNSAALTLTNSTITGNRADEGGGIYIHSSHMTMIHSSIASNKVGRSSRSGITTGSGGGIQAKDSQIAVISSTIRSNSTGSHGSGGGIQAISSLVTIENSKVYLNHVHISGDGGGIDAVASPLTINNSAIYFNGAGLEYGKGGGIAAFSSPVMIVSSTIALNKSMASTGNSGGGGIFAKSSSVIVRGSNLLTNTASTGGALYNNRSNSEDTPPIRIENSCIVGNSMNAIHNNSSSSAITITAQTNWWGTSDGPGGALGGSGDGVSDYVDGSNFLTEPILDCPTISPADTVAPDEDNVPTALDEDDEPFVGRVFLPVISR